MRFPLSLSLSLFRYMTGKQLTGKKRFPLVLMLEPLHACNLRCSGCGRIREYAETMHKRLSLRECLDSVDQCGAPIVSICGGEPLLYPEIRELIEGVIARGKHIYLCTNGLLMEEKIAEFEKIENKTLKKKFKTRLYWNVHLDGPESVHDAIVEKPGVYAQAIRGIEAAKKAGYFVYTNTTLYKQSTLESLVAFAQDLEKLQIDGIMLAPGYGYEAVENESFFLTREDVFRLFREIREKMSKFRITTTPIFMDFLCGERPLRCAAFANPTRNVAGWKAPCYLITDGHFETYTELVEKTDWEHLGYGEDPRCEHCLSHCGYEPAAVFACDSLKELLRITRWQFG